MWRSAEDIRNVELFRELCDTLGDLDTLVGIEDCRTGVVLQHASHTSAIRTIVRSFGYTDLVSVPVGIEVTASEL